MYKTTIAEDNTHLADWYSSSVRDDKEEVAELIGRLVQEQSLMGYSVVGANHLGEYAYFNHRSRALAIIGMANFLLYYPFELHLGCPAELEFELMETSERMGKVWFCSYPQKQCNWLSFDRLQARDTK